MNTCFNVKNVTRPNPIILNVLAPHVRDNSHAAFVFDKLWHFNINKNNAYELIRA